MKRRKFLQVISTIPVAAAVPLLAQEAVKSPGHSSPVIPDSSASSPPADSVAGFPKSSSSAAPLLRTTYFEDVSASSPGFFTREQFSALRRMSELFMPRVGEKPGGLDAEAAEFLDFYTSVSLPDRQQLYRSGLDNLNHRAKARFAKPFASLTNAEADSILKPLFHPRGSSGALQAFLELGPFVNRAYQDIRIVTINSPAWAESERAAGINILTPLCWATVDPTLPLRSRIDAINADKQK